MTDKGPSRRVGNILRDPSVAVRGTYDLIIIGGGIYGVMLSLEASKRGLKSLLLERDDFGGATTFNSLRIIHGGLRYLQSLDLKRFHESVGERRWFLRNFPNLVRPLPFIMPLYGDGSRRPLIFRVALWINDFLSCRRNHGIERNGHLPAGRILNPEKTRRVFPAADPRGLRGSALWYDAWLPDSQRLIVEILRSSCGMGARALNYVEAVELLKSRQGVTGVTAFDRESRESHEYRANVVVNAAGPWCRELATRFDRDEPSLFRSSLAWNILLDREAVSDHAVAVTPKKPGARTYFIVPWKGLVLVGTGHAPWRSSSEKPMPSCQQIQEFLDDLNLSVPGLKVDQNDILHLFAGLLPVKRDGSVDLVCREVILDHANKGGPKGLFSVSGVKFTTARLVAEKTLRRTFPETKFSRQFTHRPGLRQSAYALDSYNTPNLVGLLDTRIGSIKDSYRHLVEEESVQHLDDLIFRRTTLWENPRDAISVAPLLCDLFPWNDFRCREEIERLASKLSNGHSQQDSG